MPGKFIWKKFAEIDVNEIFFNSLKDDYTEFSDWFQKKNLLRSMKKSNENN